MVSCIVTMLWKCTRAETIIDQSPFVSFSVVELYSSRAWCEWSPLKGNFACCSIEMVWFSQSGLCRNRGVIRGTTSGYRLPGYQNWQCATLSVILFTFTFECVLDHLQKTQHNMIKWLQFFQILDGIKIECVWIVRLLLHN